MKKKYNPFKMWGSWIGGVIGIILFKVIGFSFLNKIFGNVFITKITFGGGMAGGYYMLIYYIILGFLIGWGIHSLFRRLKK